MSDEISDEQWAYIDGRDDDDRAMMAEQRALDLRPVNQRTGEIKDISLTDDLADVLTNMVVGWEDKLGVDLAKHPEVQRVMARYRSEHEHLRQLVLWGGEVDTDCTLFGNSLHSRIDGVIQRTDPATWMIRVVEPESEL